MSWPCPHDTLARPRRPGAGPNSRAIYEDRLTRDFGHDPALLRAQVERTVRHEIAHHLGRNESGVRGLGL
ncbi:MAG: metallopeptidase family protein [Solirubrobacterales bacterium]